MVKSFHLKCNQPFFKNTDEKATVVFKVPKQQQIDFIFGTDSFSLAPLIERNSIKSISAFEMEDNNSCHFSREKKKKTLKLR